MGHLTTQNSSKADALLWCSLGRTCREDALQSTKSGCSATIICGSNAEGEPSPPHFQLKTLAKTDEAERIRVDWFVSIPHIRGPFGHKEIQSLPCTFGLNERAGMNAIELHKYISKAILPLYPDVADEPLKRVIIKLDSGPGRMNVDILAELGLKGVYVIPGVPNTTHVTQETDQNYSLFKRTYRVNLRALAQAKHQLRKSLQVTDLAYLVFGGTDNKTSCKLADLFSRAFSHENNLKCWRKCGSIPLTRMPLALGLARHELGVDGRIENLEEREQVRLKRLDESNRHYCDFLTANGFDSMSLRKSAPVRKITPAVTAPQSKERILALKRRKTAGNHFHATGGQHFIREEHCL